MNVHRERSLAISEEKQNSYREIMAESWSRMSLANQVGNVGSEYERALRARANGNSKYFDVSVACLFDLLDLTIADSRWSERRLQKLRQMREMIWNELCNVIPHSPKRDLRKYFLLAGLWANKQRAQERNRQLEIGNRT